MKRYFIYIIMVVAALFVGCTTADLTETPEMTDVGNIEVSFSVDGTEVNTLNLPSVSQEVVVDVTLNVEGVYWTPISDKEWCQIVEEEHRGSGSFTIVVNANNSFDARETANITFQAGEFAVSKLAVNHSGNVFLFDQVYAAALNSASSVTTAVRTLEGVEWDFDNNGWISGAKGASTTVDGVTTTEVTISWVENTDASRFGELHFVTPADGDADGVFYVWQYGSDVDYDEEGNLLVAAQDAEPLEVRVPAQTVKEVIAPSWVSVEERTNSDKTVSYMLSFAGNPSDARIIRASEISLSMLSGTADVALPVVKQMYYVVDGIMTGEGFKAFAKAWNEGADVSQWHINGVPTFMGDIEMSEVEEWVSIGTEEHPFTGKFNGNGKIIKGLKSKHPLFGVCNGAEIEGITFDAECEFVAFEDFGSSYFLSALAADIRATTVTSCTNNAKVQFEAPSIATDECHVYVAGLVGKADATSTVQLCTNSGPVTITNSCSNSVDEGEVYVGGIVACNAGGVHNGFNNAEVTSGAISYYNWIGGVVGKSDAGANLQSNLNAGKVHYKSPKGMGTGCVVGYIGGVAGEVNGTVAKNTNDGQVISASPTTTVYVGGVAGKVDAETTLTENSNRVNSKIEASNTPKTIYVGGHYGLLDLESFTLEATDAIEFGGNIACGQCVDGATLYAGGFVGSTNGTLTLKGINRIGDIDVDLARTVTVAGFHIGGIVGGTPEDALTITDSTTSGAITIISKNGSTAGVIKGKYYVGGAVGSTSAGVTLTNVTNATPVAFSAKQDAAKSNPFHMGGIIGTVLDGNAVITDCTNSAKITNIHYNNRQYDTGYACDSAGGIAGSCGFSASYAGTVTISGCKSTADVTTYRGIVGGIAGFLKNATVSDCSFTAGIPLNYENTGYGGIVCIAEETTITNCTVKGAFSGKSAGSCIFNGGGIAGYILGESVVDGCSFFGNLTASFNANKEKDEYLGGLVGRADEDGIIKNSKYGGTVNGVDITANNFDKYIQGVNAKTGAASLGTVENCSYWDGK
ncbi:MAG: hypothetical protein E7147_06130 [Rikenellaceae bacterium]|nr:hypothetical protein [Rikenellaceae bacterium]